MHILRILLLPFILPLDRYIFMICFIGISLPQFIRSLRLSAKTPISVRGGYLKSSNKPPRAYHILEVFEAELLERGGY